MSLFALNVSCRATVDTCDTAVCTTARACPPVYQYGTEIGLAFQIVDDILDEEGSSVSLGKTAGKDRAAGKPTYPAFFGLDRSRQLAGECRTNANQALERAGLLDSRLADIASWIIDRTT